MSNNGQRSGRGRMASGRPVMVVEIIKAREFTTRGNGTAQKVLVGPVFQDIGPYVEDIVVHVFGQNATSQFNYTIRAQYSYDGETWVDFANPIANATAGNVNKYVISAPYAVRADFGRFIRFQVEVNDNGTAVEAAQLSASVAFRFWS